MHLLTRHPIATVFRVLLQSAAYVNRKLKFLTFYAYNHKNFDKNHVFVVMTIKKIS